MMTHLPSTNHESESDDYLLELIGLKEDFPEEALEAYGKLYERYWDKMYLIALKVNSDPNRPGWEAEAQDLVSDTFQKVFQKASKFTKGDADTPKKLQLRVLGWMTRLMRNCFYDLYLDEEIKQQIKNDRANKTNEPTPDDLYLPRVTMLNHFDDGQDEFIDALDEKEKSDEIEPFDANTKNEESDNMVLVRKYLNSLPTRDKQIVLKYYNAKLPGKNIPSALLDLMEKEFNTTRVNIRRIISNFKKAITQALQDEIIRR
jgi:RNA polymerase sigma factor (sigma-70 family)